MKTMPVPVSSNLIDSIIIYMVGFVIGLTVGYFL